MLEFNLCWVLIKISEYVGHENSFSLFGAFWAIFSGMNFMFLLTFSCIDITGKTCWTSSGLLMVRFSSPVQSIIYALYGMRTKVEKIMHRKHNYIMNIC